MLLAVGALQLPPTPFAFFPRHEYPLLQPPQVIVPPHPSLCFSQTELLLPSYPSCAQVFGLHDPVLQYPPVLVLLAALLVLSTTQVLPVPHFCPQSFGGKLQLLVLFTDHFPHFPAQSTVLGTHDSCAVNPPQKKGSALEGQEGL
jgi:hypothetical protein